MVLPLYDDDSDRLTFPVVNYVLIAVNVLVFLIPQRLGTPEGDKFTYAFATVPEEIVTGRDVAEDHVISDPITGKEVDTIRLEPTPGSVYLTLLTSMFMHGGIAHLLG